MKQNLRLTTSFLLVATVALIAPVSADEAPAKDAPAEQAPAADEHKVARGDLRATVELSALVTAGRAVELSLSPKEWADLTVERAVSHGAKVREGDVLVVLETEKLTEQIADLEKARESAKLTLEQTEAALRNLEASTPLQLKAADEGREQAAEELAYFEKKGREQAEKSARWMVESAEQSLEGAEEELDQLTKMYEADDLTEETEEIVVRRARYAVESARKRLESTRLASERSLATEIPRQHEALRVAVRTAEIAAENAHATLPRALHLKHLEMAKAREDAEKAQRTLKNLREDLARMEIRAPEDGFVYYGSASDGKWDGAAPIAKKLVPGGKLTPHEVFMTVVSEMSGPLVALVPEDKLFLLRDGTRGTATPAFDPRLALPVRLDHIDHVPQPGGGFLSKLSLDAKADAAKLLAPGMSLKATFEPVNEKNVLTIPLGAAFEQDGATVAYVKKEAGPEAVTIATGATDGKMIVVKTGLAEGDVVLTSRP